jgi:hypothetical protein
MEPNCQYPSQYLYGCGPHIRIDPPEWLRSTRQHRTHMPASVTPISEVGKVKKIIGVFFF